MKTLPHHFFTPPTASHPPTSCPSMASYHSAYDELLRSPLEVLWHSSESPSLRAWLLGTSRVYRLYSLLSSATSPNEFTPHSPLNTTSTDAPLPPSHHPRFNLFVQTFLVAPLFLHDFEVSVRLVLDALTFISAECSPSEDEIAISYGHWKWRSSRCVREPSRGCGRIRRTSFADAQ
ncbi:hypothetical protein DL96DRAFT_495927 [Flagelloscypha sp. PMI_526]|nr:hypothetical protein DL96DRAFT_495927 [Flagelloscypha sp. PMI_526]